MISAAPAPVSAPELVPETSVPEAPVSEVAASWPAAGAAVPKAAASGAAASKAAPTPLSASKIASAAVIPDFIAVCVPLIFGTFRNPAVSPTSSPPGNVSFGIDWMPPSLIARAP